MEKIAKIVWTKCIGIKPKETALIVTDLNKFRIAKALWEVGESLCKECSLILTKKRSIDSEVPEQVSKAMLASDAIIAVTSYSMTHTVAVRKAVVHGARIITMSGITREMFLRAIPIDYDKLNEFGKKLKKKLKGEEIKVKTQRGTDIFFNVKGRKIFNCCGLCKKGEVLNLPDGEVCLSPLEGSAEGKIVIDLSSAPDSPTKFGKIGLVKKPFTILVEKGEAVDCTNPILWKWLTSVKNGKNLAELGIGTNPKARITGKILEDEKVLGTAHFAFGSNKYFGGKIQTSIHLDCVFNKPSIWVDDEKIIENGKLV